MPGHLIEFQLDLTYPLFIDGTHVADIDATGTFECPADEPGNWWLTAFSITGTDGKVRHLTGKAMQDAEAVLDRHCHDFIRERATEEMQEAA